MESRSCTVTKHPGATQPLEAPGVRNSEGWSTGSGGRSGGTGRRDQRGRDYRGMKAFSSARARGCFVRPAKLTSPVTDRTTSFQAIGTSSTVR